MALHAFNNKKGFSLIELMIAVVFIMISMLALLTAVVSSQRTNQENDLRNTAIRLTNQTAEALLGLSLEDPELTPTISTSNARIEAAHSRTSGNAAQNGKGFPEPVHTVRSARIIYAIQWDVKEQTTNIREITIAVGYNYRNQARSNRAVIYKHKAL